MSDGLPGANREVHVSQRIESATLELLDVLSEVYDQAFGLPEDAIVEMNEILSKVGIQIIQFSRRSR